MPDSDQLHIFILADDPSDVHRIERCIEQSDLSVQTTWSNARAHAKDFLLDSDVDVAIVNHRKESTGLEFVKEVTGRGSDLPMILVGERGDAKMATKAIRMGYDDYRSTSDLTPSCLNTSIQYAIEQYEKQQKLKKLARTDELTGLLNRHAILKRLKGELKRSARNGNVSSIILIDVDKFKAINDTFGHVTGDRVLEKIASLIQETIRESDFAGRYGGDEVLIISPSTDLNGACQLGQRILDTIDEKEFPVSEEQQPTECSVSAGCAYFDGEECKRVQQEAVTELIEWADSALYLAKDKGGCTVERRKSERVPVEDDVDTDIIFNDETCRGDLVDYSEGGVGVEVQKPIPGDESVNVRLVGSPIDGEKEISGNVAWVTEQENGTYLAGIHTENRPPINL